MSINKTILSIIKLAVFFSTMILVIGLLPKFAQAQAYPDWWQSAWQYRMSVDITENAGANLSYHQVLVILNTTSFDYSKTQANGEDLRFTSNSTVCDYWIENYNTSGESRIWVEVPSIPANSTTEIYMYYGNPAASSSSNGTATFEFFDDFEDGDISDWTQYSGGTVQIANDSGNYVLLKTTNNDPNGGYSPSFYNGMLSDYEAIFRTKRINEVGGSQNRYGIEDGSFNGYGPRMYDFNSLPSSFAIERRTGGASTW